MTNTERQQLFQGSRLFSGWSIKEVFEAIHATFVANQRLGVNNRLLAVLHPDSKNSLPSLERDWRAGHWSMGYCYYIAEVAKLMLMSAEPSIHFRLCEVNGKKPKRGRGTKSTHKLKKHFALRYDGLFFDPQRGPAHPGTKYTKIKPSRFLPQHPSINAAVLLTYVIEHLEKTRKAPRVTLTQFRPVLVRLANQYKGRGQKVALKNIVRSWAGLPLI